MLCDPITCKTLNTYLRNIPFSFFPSHSVLYQCLVLSDRYNSEESVFLCYAPSFCIVTVVSLDDDLAASNEFYL